MKSGNYPIPVKTNLTLVIVFSLSYIIVYWIASRVTNFALLAGISILFAFLMIPVYSLLHEAEHGTLQTDPTINDWVGRWLCLLFVAPYTFLKHCHLKHHKKNRTDEEMWDLYYEHQVKWKRYGNLYGMMIGLGYFAIWLSVLLFAVSPPLLKSGLFRSHKEIGGFIKGSEQQEKVRQSRWESLSVVLFQTSLALVFQPPWTNWLTIFAVHGLVWSSQNYVPHAFSPRSIVNGAHNLTLPSFLRFIYLHFNLHLAHHQHPNVPWIHLSSLVQPENVRKSFFRNYLRLWKGPVLTHEKEPGCTTGSEKPTSR